MQVWRDEASFVSDCDGEKGSACVLVNVRSQQLNARCAPLSDVGPFQNDTPGRVEERTCPRANGKRVRDVQSGKRFHDRTDEVRSGCP